jgi:hypothetical protein
MERGTLSGRRGLSGHRFNIPDTGEKNEMRERMYSTASACWGNLLDGRAQCRSAVERGKEGE